MRIHTQARPRRHTGYDLQTWPVIGSFLRWRHARTSAQVTLLFLAALVLFDGWFGPQIAPKNLAGVLPWVHWRGLVVLALLVFGNLFCFACPFLLPRRLAQRVFRPSRPWPRWLPGKWLAVILLFFFFWVYEAFDLWASPWLTAWVATAYFATAFVIDGFFKGAAFCKHVCPIGQFNFFGSLISPTQVAVRDPSLCSQCKTKDCIHGRFDERGRLRQQGCELGLFQPRKVGNLDCTFCLDCIQACPYQNVTILVRPPLHAERDLEANRSGIGRLPARTDWLALVILFVALGLLNAFGMVSPVYRLLSWLSHTLRVAQEPLLILLLFGTGIVTFLLALAFASLLSSGLTRQYSARWFFRRLIFTLIPLGFAMWSAHYLFHFLTGALTVIPVLQQFVFDWVGVPLLGQPNWSLAGVISLAKVGLVVRVVLVVGLLLSLAWLLDLGRRYRLSSPTLLPWIALLGGLWLIGIWLLSQPMEMRGTLLG